jgi:17beta-estradiol 17-dehydrogenase / very-long-chain 3-oxoacyl-CoA reductase
VTVLGVVSLIRIGFWVFDFIKGDLPNLLGKGKNPKSFGSWAAVTGCTSGIGESYAHELAKKGVNVVLISRSKEQLDRVSQEIQTKYKVQTKIIAVDLGAATTAEFQKVIAELKSISDLGILVNNAGLAHDPEYFLDVKLEDHRNILLVNNRALVELTHGLLPFFLNRKRGAIVNVSSLTGLTPMPLLASYSASKAFVDSFTLSLAAEYQAKGIVFQSLTPGYVVSKMSGIKRANIMAPTADTFAKKSLASLGASTTVTGARSIPYPVHYIMGKILPCIVPAFLMPGLAFKELLKTRAAQQKKKASSK